MPLSAHAQTPIRPYCELLLSQGTSSSVIRAQSLAIFGAVVHRQRRRAQAARISDRLPAPVQIAVHPRELQLLQHVRYERPLDVQPLVRARLTRLEQRIGAQRVDSLAPL